MNDELFERILLQLEPTLAQEFTYAVFHDVNKLIALEIIKEKRVNVYLLMKCQNVNDYNKFSMDANQCHNLGEKEFNLLKEELL